MKGRPFLWICLFLCAVSLILFRAGDSKGEGMFTDMQESVPSPFVSGYGRIYKQEQDKIYLTSVYLWAADSRQYTQYKTKLMIVTEDRTCYETGMKMAFYGQLSLFSRATNPGEFDTREYYQSIGVGAKLTKAQLQILEEAHFSLPAYAREAGLRIKRRLRQIYPEKEASVLEALLVGDRSRLDEDVKEMYRRNGILHILSISSLHISILGMGLVKLLKRLGMPIWAAGISGAVWLVFYGMMTGFGVSASRAIGMFLLYILAGLLGRTYDLMTALGCMAACFLLTNPAYSHHAGFLLSFTSVAGIGVVSGILISKGKKKDEKRIRTVMGALHTGLLSGLTVTLTTLPVQLWFYYEIPLLSPILNLIVLPLMEPLMILTLISLCPGCGGVGYMVRSILGLYQKSCEVLERFPVFNWNPGKPQGWQIVVYYLLLAAILFLLYRQKRRLDGEVGQKTGLLRGGEVGQKTGLLRGGEVGQKTGLLRGGIGKKKLPPGAVPGWQRALIFLPVLIFLYSGQPTDQLTFLDVGQGDCCIFRSSGGSTYLFDCGSSSRREVGERVLIPYLKSEGIRTLDGIFLSHPDKDHINGALELLLQAKQQRIRIRQLILPWVEEAKREELFGEIFRVLDDMQGDLVPVTFCKAGDKIGTEEWQILCLHPGMASAQAGYEKPETNEISQCFLISLGNSFRALLTGDVEKEGEKQLTEELVRRQITGIDLLKCAHHGSRNSTTESFLNSISHAGRQMAVISAGEGNSYGHPHRETMERLEAAGMTVYSTMEKGAITVRRNQKGGIAVECYAAAE